MKMNLNGIDRKNFLSNPPFGLEYCRIKLIYFGYDEHGAHAEKVIWPEQLFFSLVIQLPGKIYSGKQLFICSKIIRWAAHSLKIKDREGEEQK